MSAENPETTGKKYKFYKVLTWAMLGAVLTYIVCAMSLTGDHTWNGPFFNCGQVSEVSINSFRRDIVQEKGYQEKSGIVVMEQGFFHYTLSISDYSDKWNYLCVRIDDLESESYQWKLTFETVKDDEVVESLEETYDLSEGMNTLSLPDQSFNRLLIYIYGDNGGTYRIESLQFRENPPVSNIRIAVLAGTLTVLCYLALSLVFWSVYRKSRREAGVHLYNCIEILQDWFLAVVQRLSKLQSRWHTHTKFRRALRTILFLFMFSYSVVVINLRTYNSSFRFYILINVLILIAIAVLSVEEKPSRKNWNNPLVWGWLIMGILMCVSDVVVLKEEGNYRFFGFVLIFVIGFFIFVWNNMKDRGEVLEDFVRAVHAFFIIGAVYCVLFRPDNADTRYLGYTNNPNVLGLFMVAFWAIILGSLEHEFRTRKKKWVLLLYVLEACLVLSFAWKTQSATSLLAIGLVAVIWLVRMIVCAFRNERKKLLVGTLVCAIVLFLPVHIALSFGLTHVPQKLGTEVVYEDEVLIEKIQIGTVAYASDSSSELLDNRLFQKLTSSSAAQALAGRTYIYKEFMRDLNLFGHEDRPEVYGFDELQMPHNELLGRAYYYGIFTVVPYVIMLVAALVRTWKFGRKKIKYASVPFLITASFIAAITFENVELPFYRFLWICMYLLMGCAFSEESLIEGEEDPCYNKKLNFNSKEVNQIEQIEFNGEEA